ncbi:uncharacterized protein LOC109827909 [Asparagus officinalis]|uniref:uncharacterized protein LOC109827909 n=1 Tax=Asparagus officinalis TaxID=4686 RepID=UPI00098E2030|nr:uncharacterized protein LOC109827909 [Asparagus officinalis]
MSMRRSRLPRSRSATQSPERERLSFTGTIIEAQSSVAQTQLTIPTTEMTAAATGISLVEQVLRPTGEVGTSTAAISATVLKVPEVVLAKPSAGHQLEETSLDFGSSSRLSGMVKALLSVDDPDQALLFMEVGSLFFFVNAMIDKLLVKGFSFHQFIPALANKINIIEKTGSSDLAQAIANDLDRLEREFQRLQELKTTGTSTYITDQMESRLQVWRDTRASAGLEIQTQQSRVDQMEAALLEKQTSLCQLKSSITSGEAKIERLKEELKAEEEALVILGMTIDDLES